MGFVAALQDRLLDYDEKVRVAVVKVIYDLAKADLKSVPTDVLRKVAERLRDKKVHGQEIVMRTCGGPYSVQGPEVQDALVCYKGIRVESRCSMLELCVSMYLDMVL